MEDYLIQKTFIHPDSYILSNHFKILKVKSFFKSKIKDREIACFIKDNISFLYPNICKIKFNFDTEHNIIAHKYNYIAESLSNILVKYGINRIIIDLENTKILSEIILNIINTYQNNSEIDLIGILCNDEVQKYILNKQPTISKIYYTDAVSARYDYLKNNKNSLRSIKITLSNSLSLDELEVKLKHYNLSSKFNNVDLIVIDLQNVVGIDLISVNALLIHLHTLAHKSGVLYDLILPTFKNPRHELIESRFVKLLGPYLIERLEKFQPEIDKRESYNKLCGPRFGIVSFSPESFDHPYDQFFESLDEYVSNRDKYYNIVRFFNVKTIETAWKRMTLIMRELCQNVKEHSNGVGYLSFSANEPNKFQIIVADVGKGLKKGLKQNYNLKINSDEDAIKKLIELNKYKKYRKEDKRGGNGFSVVKNIIKSFKGNFTIRTGNSYVSYNYDEEKDLFEIVKMRKNLSRIEGTSFFIDIPVE
jgi:hypothetical protein